MCTPRYTFKKEERLRKKRHIDALFQSKENSFTCFPFRVLYKNSGEDKETTKAQILISIPKRKIKKAVDRNLLKRRTREAYRKQKQQLYDFLPENETTLRIALVYISEEILPYTIISEAVEATITELKKRL